jgi:hypothetical protein
MEREVDGRLTVVVRSQIDEELTLEKIGEDEAPTARD